MAPKDTPDLSEFLVVARPKKRPCQVGLALQELQPPERAQLEAACAADTGIINNAAIQRWLQVRGHKVSNPAVTSHRRATCKCHE